MEYKDFLYWEATSKDTIDFKRIYVDMTGDIVAGLMLSEIVYWHLPSRSGHTKLRVEHDGKLWIAVRRYEWWDRARISPKQADRCLETLRDLGIIETAIYKYDGSPTIHIRLLEDGFMHSFESNLEAPENPFLPESEDRSSQKGNNDLSKKGRTLTETTTETTYTSGGLKEDEIGSEESPRDYFDRLERERGEQESKPVDREQYRQRISDSISRWARDNENKTQDQVEIENYLAKVPEYYRGLARAFCESFGRIPIGSQENKRWHNDWINQHERGVSPEHVRQAIERMRRDGLTIKAPASTTSIAESIMRSTSQYPDGTYFGATELWSGGERIY